MPRASFLPLEYLGLDAQTAAVYVALLPLGKAKASDIAKKAKCTRTSVYRCLERLEEEGFVHSEIREGVQCYSALDPQAIPGLMQKQAEEVQSLLPTLIQLFSRGTQGGTSFRFYGEASGIRTVLEEVLKTPSKTYDIFGSIYDDEFIYSVTEAYLANWMERRIKARIHHRSLRPQVAKQKQQEIKNPSSSTPVKKSCAIFATRLRVSICPFSFIFSTIRSPS